MYLDRTFGLDFRSAETTSLLGLSTYLDRTFGQRIGLNLSQVKKSSHPLTVQSQCYLTTADKDNKWRRCSSGGANLLLIVKLSSQNAKFGTENTHFGKI